VYKRNHIQIQLHGCCLKQLISLNLNIMYFVTLGQFQLYSLGNSDEDWVNNAQLLRLRGQTNRKT